MDIQTVFATQTTEQIKQSALTLIDRSPKFFPMWEVYYCVQQALRDEYKRRRQIETEQQRKIDGARRYLARIYRELYATDEEWAQFLSGGKDAWFRQCEFDGLYWDGESWRDPRWEQMIADAKREYGAQYATVVWG